jgi:hypothetical protein
MRFEVNKILVLTPPPSGIIFFIQTHTLKYIRWCHWVAEQSVKHVQTCEQGPHRRQQKLSVNFWPWHDLRAQ